MDCSGVIAGNVDLTRSNSGIVRGWYDRLGRTIGGGLSWIRRHLDIISRRGQGRNARDAKGRHEGGVKGYWNVGQERGVHDSGRLSWIENGDKEHNDHRASRDDRGHFHGQGGGLTGREGTILKTF